MNRKQLKNAFDKVRRVEKPQRFVDARELAKGVDNSLDTKQLALWKRIKLRFNDEAFTHSLLDRMITTFLINLCAAAVWLCFFYIVWKVVMRG